MLKRIFLSAALFWTVFVVFLCLVSSKDIPSIDIENLDKVIHAFLHFVFTLLWFLFFKKQIGAIKNHKLLLLALVLSFMFGVALELMQKYFTVTRDADVFDTIANLFGATIAVVFIILLNKYNGIIDKM